MSKAFVKDDAHDEVIVAARPPLPPGTPNYVTARGLSLLEAEREALLAERSRLQSAAGDDLERARGLAAVAERLEALTERLGSAQLLRPDPARRAEVGFGSTVTTRALSGRFAGEEQRFTITGVDEAAGDDTRVAFSAPIARALQGRRLGEQVTMKMPRGEQTLEIVALTCASDE
jgi:transcription elongation factor GreB